MTVITDEEYKNRVTFSYQLTNADLVAGYALIYNVPPNSIMKLKTITIVTRVSAFPTIRLSDNISTAPVVNAVIKEFTMNVPGTVAHVFMNEKVLSRLIVTFAPIPVPPPGTTMLVQISADIV